MKKIITFAAAAAMASSSAIAGMDISGEATFTLTKGTATDTSDDKMTQTHEASLTFSGASADGNTTFSATLPLEHAITATTAIENGDAAGSADDPHTATTTVDAISIFTDVEVATKINDISVAANLSDKSLSVGLDFLSGEVAVGVDGDTNITLSTTVSGIEVSYVVHGVNDADNDTNTKGAATISGELAGMTFEFTKEVATWDVLGAPDTFDDTWEVGVTFNGIGLTLDSDSAIGASMGLAGNTLTISKPKDGDPSVEVARDINDNASVTAKYDGDADEASLSATVSF